MRKPTFTIPWLMRSTLYFAMAAGCIVNARRLNLAAQEGANRTTTNVFLFLLLILLAPTMFGAGVGSLLGGRDGRGAIVALLLFVLVMCLAFANLQ